MIKNHIFSISAARVTESGPEEKKIGIVIPQLSYEERVSWKLSLVCVASKFCILMFLILATTVSGCKSNSNIPIQKKKPLNAAEARAARPGAITGKGWSIKWRERNPENPSGPAMPVLYADSKTGIMEDRNDNVVLQLNTVHARLYQNGTYSATVIADQVDANQHNKIVIGTGHVKVNSVTNPPDTQITADMITWDTNSRKIVAEGNTRVVRQPKNGSPAFTHEGGIISFDPGLQEFEIK